MPVFKALSFLLVLLLCSCSNAGKSSTNSPDAAPATDKQNMEKSARDTSLEDHTEEIKKMEKGARRRDPSRFSDHIITKSPDGNEQGEEGDPLKRREMATKGGGR